MFGDDDEIEGQPLVVELEADPTVAVEIESPKEDQDPKLPASIEIETAPPQAPAQTPPPIVEDKPDPTIELQKRLDEISRKVEEERRERDAERKRREEAEALTLQIASEKEQRDKDLVDARIQAVTSALSAEEAEMERAEAMMRHATAKKDNTLFVQAQKAMMSTLRRIEDLKEGQQALTQQKDQLAKRPPITVPSQVQTQPQAPATPPGPQTHDQAIQRYTPRTQDYLKKRDASWVTDQRQLYKLMSAHWSAVGEGHVVDSDSYFEAIDKQMGHGNDKAPDPAPKPDPVPAKKSVPAAPVTTKSASSPAGSKVQVSLSPREQQAAKDLNISNAEYAKRKHIMSQPGWNGPRFGQNG